MSDVRPDHGGATVLEVDDDPASRYFVTRVLREAGFETLEAATGKEALALAPKASLVVLDIHLPDINGLVVAKRLRSDPATRHVPVVHLSATFTTEEDRALGLEGGAAAYLTQPVDPQVLVSTVETVLRSAREPKLVLRTDFTTERLTRMATTILRMEGVVLRMGEGPESRFVFAPRRSGGERVDLGATFDEAAVALKRIAGEGRAS